ncbi:hypothetical protein TNCV_1809771 [Trichonephila clavipes]|nr:hypothetical protein TNCV_1809771 [Trichonephila clavipes]
MKSDNSQSGRRPSSEMDEGGCGSSGMPTLFDGGKRLSLEDNEDDRFLLKIKMRQRVAWDCLFAIERALSFVKQTIFKCNCAATWEMKSSDEMIIHFMSGLSGQSVEKPPGNCLPPFKLIR